MKYIYLIFIFLIFLIFLNNYIFYFKKITCPFFGIVEGIFFESSFSKYFEKKIVFCGFDKCNDTFHYAYVAFTTGGNYLQRMLYPIIAHDHFSKYPLLLFYAGPTINFSDYRIFKKLIIFHILPEKNGNSFFMKLRVSMIAPVLFGQIIESDTLIWNSDLLFPRIEEEITTEYPYPIMPKHPKYFVLNSQYGYNSSNYLHYNHAHLTWSYYSLPFLSHVYIQCYNKTNFYESDEMALNIELWKIRAYKQWCTYDPYFKYLHELTKIKFNTTYLRYGNSQHPLFLYLIHGAKKIIDLKTTILLMKNYTNLSYYYLINSHFYQIPHHSVYFRSCMI